ncbi:MAG: hypothetical protein ACXWVD_16330 [Telluria sp.]
MDTTTEQAPDARLDAAIRELKQEMAACAAPRGVEKELMAAFALQHRRPRWYQRLSPLRWAVAAGLAGALALPVFLATLPAPDGAALLAGRDAGGDFFAIESLDTIEREPNPRVIEADLPRTELASLGVPVSPENAGESVRAEMLVSADGRPLAFRLSSIQ